MGLTKHRQVRIEHGKQSAAVDERIAPLILATWRAGITTHCSCQDVVVGLKRGNLPATMYVGFPTAADAARWLAIVFRRRERHRAIFSPWRPSRDTLRWSFEVSPSLPTGFYLFVFFPQRALAAITARLRAKHRRTRWPA